MNSSKIEIFDRKRYTALKWFFIIWGIWFGSIILDTLHHEYHLFAGKFIYGTLVVVRLLGAVAFIMILIHWSRINKKISLDPELKKALGNEMYRYNTLKAIRTGYFITLAVVGIIYAISLFIHLPGKLICEIIIFASVLSGSITNLIYHKRNDA